MKLFNRPISFSLKRNYIILLLTVLSTFSCHDKVPVTFIERGTQNFQDSSILVLDFHYKDHTGKHLLDSATRNLPLYMPYYKTVWDTAGVFYEALEQLKIGDSAHFSLSAEQFYGETMGTPESIATQSLSEDSQIHFFVRLQNQMTEEAFFAMQDSLDRKSYEDYINNTAHRNKEQGEKIDEYLRSNNLNGKATESGLRYVITTEGSGEIANNGDLVTIHFHGTLLNGQIFGSSLEDNIPYQFELGTGEVIPAWEETASILKAGTKAIILAPSDLGFGYMNRLDVPGNSILKYEIEILEVKSKN